MNPALFSPVVFVKQDEKAVVERFGKFHRLLEPGIHFLIPFVEKLQSPDFPDPMNPKKVIKSGKIPLSVQTLFLPKDDRAVFTKNKNALKVKAQALYQITDPYKAVYEVAYLFDALNQLIFGILQKRILELEPSPDNTTDKAQDEVAALKTILEHTPGVCDEYTENWGIKILKVKVIQITDSKGIRHNFHEA